jgi:uncharacterized protein (TIGR00255 family)
MVLSMTGFGRAKGEYRRRTFSVDIRSLNGKTTDIRVKVPPYFKSREIELRRYVLDRAGRGKLDLSIQITAGDEALEYTLNMKLFERYFKDLQELASKYGLENQDFIQSIMRIPSVIETNDEEIDHDEWAYVLSVVEVAVDQLTLFRKNEGEAMCTDMISRTQRITSLLEEVEKCEQPRREHLTNRLQKMTAEHLSFDNLDENRLEQELVYYLEKMDINEEKVRLAQHCRHFTEVVRSEDFMVGKKLSFISQEMGREINTMGAKAQHSPLQQLVVEMKVELDQIREQLANVL